MEHPGILENYGNPSSSLHVYFSFSFITMGAFEYEDISDKLKVEAKLLQRLELIWIAALLITILIFVVK